MIFKVTNTNELLPDMQLIKLVGSRLYTKGYIIAGGAIWCAIRNIELNDIDIFSTIKGKQCTIDIFIQSLKEAGYSDIKYELLPTVSKFAVNYDVTVNGKTYKIQFINAEGKAVGTPDVIVNNFDIKNVAVFINEKGNVASSHIEGARVPRGSTLPISEYAGNRRLMSQNLIIGYVTNPKFTLDRILKYQTRGLEVNHNDVWTILSIIQKAKDYLRQLKQVFETPTKNVPPPEANVFTWGSIRAAAIVSNDEAYEEFTGLNSTGFTIEDATEFNRRIDNVLHVLLKKVTEAEHLSLVHTYNLYKGDTSSD